MSVRHHQEAREHPGTTVQRAKWNAQATPTLQAFSDGLWDGKQRLFVRMFVFDSGGKLLSPAHMCIQLGFFCSSAHAGAVLGACPLLWATW